MTLEHRIAMLEEAVFGAAKPAPAPEADDESERGLKVLKAIYPNARLDDQDKIHAEWADLSPIERIAALNGVAPFIAALFAIRRNYPPAVWCYLRDRRWTMVPPLTIETGEAR